MAEPGKHRYYWLPRDEVLVRLQDGWHCQVWQGSNQMWADFSVDIAGEANPVSEEEVRELAGDEPIDDHEDEHAYDEITPSTPSDVLPSMAERKTLMADFFAANEFVDPETGAPFRPKTVPDIDVPEDEED